MLATFATRASLRKTSALVEVMPRHERYTYLPETVAVRTISAGGGGCGGGGWPSERRIAPLVGPSVTEVVEVPSYW